MKTFMVAAVRNVCLLMFLVACVWGNLSAAGDAAADKEVSFKVTQVELSGNKILLHGNFRNETEAFQRVKQITVHYTLSDEDGYPLLIGSCRGSDMDVSVGDSQVPYTLTAENIHAPEFSSRDIAVWKIRSNVEVE